MELTLQERIALLEANLAELRQSTGFAANREYVKETLFFSSLAAGDQVLVADTWQVVSTVDNTNVDSLTLTFESGLEVTWTKNTPILRRAIPSRIPDRPNTTPRNP